jgi:hypothetical protein
MVAVTGEAGLVREVLAPVDEVLAAIERERVDVRRVGHERAELGRVPLAEEVVLLAEALDVLLGQRAVRHRLPQEVACRDELGDERLELGHERFHRQRVRLARAPTDVLERADLVGSPSHGQRP